MLSSVRQEHEPLKVPLKLRGREIQTLSLIQVSPSSPAFRSCPPLVRAVEFLCIKSNPSTNQTLVSHFSLSVFFPQLSIAFLSLLPVVQAKNLKSSFTLLFLSNFNSNPSANLVHCTFEISRLLLSTPPATALLWVTIVFHLDVQSPPDWSSCFHPCPSVDSSPQKPE